MSDDVRDPWWASGAGPTDGLHDDEDPLDRYAAARRGVADGAGGAWWQEAVDALADAARSGGNGHRHDRDHDAPPTSQAAAGDVCHVCPVCVALRALDQSRPEVVAHLSEALRHVSLAARAFVEAQVAATGAADDGLQRVDLDDD